MNEMTTTPPADAQVSDEDLAQWAADPAQWKDPVQVLTGDDAAAYGRGLLTDAGIDVDAVDRTVGRPRVGGDKAIPGVRSPRVNVAISATANDQLHHLEQQRGVSRSELVREAIDYYLHLAG
jgi:hypothetical protein